ncbi:hypothetical protein [Aeromicrobium sp.]|uniref:hypothetical protein n=1 Tax=Aeromicrobium sp. TaxID=1871063 RepID=UPI0028B0BDE2|nr:hypothetical protein [Aeromicrobium sp.]
MIALALGFLCGIAFTVSFAVVLATGVVSRALVPFTMADDEAELEDHVHPRGRSVG